MLKQVVTSLDLGTHSHFQEVTELEYNTERSMCGKGGYSAVPVLDVWERFTNCPSHLPLFIFQEYPITFENYWWIFSYHLRRLCSPGHKIKSRKIIKIYLPFLLPIILKHPLWDFPPWETSFLFTKTFIINSISS